MLHRGGSVRAHAEGIPRQPRQRLPKLNVPPSRPRRRGSDKPPPDGGQVYSGNIAEEFPDVYTLRAIPSGNWMGFSSVPLHDDEIPITYIIAFKYEEHAKMVCSFAHEATKMHLERFVMENITKAVEEVCQVPIGSFKDAGLPPVFADLDAHICIEKKPNINKLGCEIAQLKSIEYMAIPFEQSIGVVLARRIVENTKRIIVFESEVINPIRDLDLFRQMLVKDQV